MRVTVLENAFRPSLTWAKAHERHLSAAAMVVGFVFDSWAFGRIDHALTQAVFIVYLLVAGIAIAVMHGLNRGPRTGGPPPAPAPSCWPPPSSRWAAC